MKSVDWREQWSQVKVEWRENRRLQTIVIFALVIFVFWIHLQLNQGRVAARNNAHLAQRSYGETLAAAKEKSWPDKSKEASLKLKKLKGMLWHANTEGEAQALIRDWLDREAQKLGVVITRSNIIVGEALPGTNLRPVRADIQGKYKVGIWQQFLISIRKNQQLIAVDYELLNLTNEKNQLYRLNLTAWFTIAAGEGKQ
jgi:hypothetical protein